MRHHRAVLVGVLAVAAVSATGCGSSDSSSTSGSSGTQPAPTATTTTAAAKAPKIAMIVSAYSDFQGAEKEGLAAAVKKAGGSYQMFNANFDPQKVLSQCQDAITSGRFNAIVLNVIQPAVGVPCVAAAKAAGMPVVALDGTIGKSADDLQPQVDGVVGGVYATPKATAKNTIELADQACKGIDPCNIIAEIATPTDPLTNETVKAVAAQVPNAKIVGKVVSGFDVTQVTKQMPDLLSAHPDTNIFLAAADSSALAALPAIRQAGLEGKIKLLGNGGSVDGAKAVADGTMFGSIGAWPQQSGRIMVEMASKALNGETIDPKGLEASTVDQPTIITKDNVSQFKPEWGGKS